MKILIISGEPNSGKTGLVNIIYNILTFKHLSTIPITQNNSFSNIFGENKINILLKINDIRVLFYDETDDTNCIFNLKNEIKNTKPDILITTCRNLNDPMRQTFAVNILDQFKGIKNNNHILTDFTTKAKDIVEIKVENHRGPKVAVESKYKALTKALEILSEDPFFL